MAQTKEFFRAIEFMVANHATNALAFAISEGYTLLHDSMTRPPCPLRELIRRHGNCDEHHVIPRSHRTECESCRLRYFIITDVNEQRQRLVE